jgi:hypothetical protein
MRALGKEVGVVVMGEVLPFLDAKERTLEQRDLEWTFLESGGGGLDP